MLRRGVVDAKLARDVGAAARQVEVAGRVEQRHRERASASSRRVFIRHR